jgi:ribonuclease G
MSEEILVNVTPMETRVAVVDNGAIQDIHIERSASRGVVGNIYSGKVVRVLPGMQAAFVDIGTERTSFIHVSDILRVDGSGRDDGSRSDNIRDHLHEGKKVVVQVTKDPLGSKGARLTTELSVSSRYLVLMPQNGHIGISQLIEDPAERERLQGLLEQMLVDEQMEQAGGFILRTAAEDAGAEEIRADLRYLKRLRAGPGAGIGGTHPGGQSRELCRAAGFLPGVRAGSIRPVGALSGRSAAVRPACDRGRNPESFGAQGGTQVRRIPGHRPD